MTIQDSPAEPAGNRLVSFNPATGERLGDVPVEVEITGWSPFIPGDADHSSLPVCALEYRFRRKDGSYAWVLDRAWIERGPGGVGVGVVDHGHQHIAAAAVGQHVAGTRGDVAAVDASVLPRPQLLARPAAPSLG